MINPMHQNFLACYPLVLEHLKSVKGVKHVKEVHDLSALQGTRQVAPQDGTVYVIFDGATPTETAGNGRFQTEELSFSFVLVKKHYTPGKVFYDENGVGETLTAIKSAFQGFDPHDDQGNALVTKEFKQRAALAIEYRDGFAFFPIRFITEVAISGAIK